jgi:hypothetical protein
LLLPATETAPRAEWTQPEPGGLGRIEQVNRARRRLTRFGLRPFRPGRRLGRGQQVQLRLEGGEAKSEAVAALIDRLGTRLGRERVRRIHLERIGQRLDPLAEQAQQDRGVARRLPRLDPQALDREARRGAATAGRR